MFVVIAQPWVIELGFRRPAALSIEFVKAGAQMPYTQAIFRKVYEMNTVKTFDNPQIPPPSIENGFKLSATRELDGDGSETIPDFNVTRAELRILARNYALSETYWYWFMFEHAQVGGGWFRNAWYAGRRFGDIAEILGQVDADAICKEVIDYYKAWVGEELWNDFIYRDCDCDREKRDKWLEEKFPSIDEENC